MTREIFAVVMVVFGFSACISMFVLVRFGCQNIDVIEDHLSNCQITRDYYNVYMAAGLIGIALRTGMAAFLLMIPKLFIYREVADSEQVTSFPADLKRRLLLRAYVFTFFGSVSMVMAAFSKLIEL